MAFAVFLAATCGASFAQTIDQSSVLTTSPGLEAKTKVSPGTAVLRGTVSIDVLERQGNPQAGSPVRPIEMPKHRLPNGGLTSDHRVDLKAPPQLPQNSEIALAPEIGGVVQYQGFTGIHDGDNVTANSLEFEPPDQGLAVYNNQIAEINNEVVRFFTTTGAALTSPISLKSFFMTSNSTGDTQVFFDPTVKRWFFTQIESNNGTIEGFGVAVSTSSNPLGSYFVYFVRAFSNDLSGCGTEDCLPDYPKGGYDANGLYISADLFKPGGAFVAAATYAIPKSKLIAGASLSYVRLTYPGDFVVQPSVPTPGTRFVTAANGTEYLMEARNIFDGSHNIRVWAISNTNNIVSSPTSLRGSGIDIAAETYTATVPSTEPNVVGPYCKSQGVTSAPQLDGGYNAFQATIQMAGTKLYGALAFDSPDSAALPRDAIAWFAVTPSVSSTGVVSASITKQGYVVPPTGYSISYPAFGLDVSGTGVLGMTITSKNSLVPGGYPSAAFMQVSGGSPIYGITVSGPGTTSDDGFTGCPGAGPGKVGRWGDYGAATQDAATKYWYSANENISGARGKYANWGTFVTQVR
jgi:hypothetical protein